ncbi:MAG: hypothetical protein VXV80_00130 [Bacteroidota bacterium]|nr:hypothetical protein [Bacteroidota bacterium]
MSLINSNIGTSDELYVPDFSYAGYHNGLKKIPEPSGTIVHASTYNVLSNDGLDDTMALQEAINETSKLKGPVTLQLPAGKIIISGVLYIERDNFILRGAGTGKSGTEIYCPRPLMYTKDPEDLKELREYLIEFDKRQKEKDNNIDLPFSQYAWSGGFIWTRVPGERVKPYLMKYNKPYEVLAKVSYGKRGGFSINISEIQNLNVGDVVELQLFNKNGKEGPIIQELYKVQDLKIGSHHWNFPDLPIVRQQVKIVSIANGKATINSPLTIDVKPEYKAQLVRWKHLSEVGIQDFSIRFPKSPRIAHHVEQGYNGIYLTNVYNSWVKNISIENADSGVLTENIANVTIEDVITKGENIAHYTVAMSGTYNVLAKGIKVYNKAVHPLSFNTLATKCVYLNCEVFVDPILDQHSGANHQNLFDNTTVHISLDEEMNYPLFKGGGAGYWKPSHGAFSTFWNTTVNVSNIGSNKKIKLNGMKDGPFARVIGVNGNQTYEVDYQPKSIVKDVNKIFEKFPSLYKFQLANRP